MRLGEIWDYFMRRKMLLLSIIVASAAVVVLGCKLCFGKTDETAGIVTTVANEAMKIDIPKTGEVIANEGEVDCIAALTSSVDDGLGGGINQDDPMSEGDAEITFWEAEVPDAEIEIVQTDDTAAKVELMIMVAGGVAAIAIISSAKFIFDHYVR